VSLLALVAIVVALEYLWPYLPGPAGPSRAPGPAGTENGVLNAPPSPSPATSKVAAPPDVVKPPAGPRSESALPVLPTLEVPMRPLFPASSAAPARGTAAEKFATPVPRSPDDDSWHTVPKDLRSPRG
ncbi:MAG: hypothetical protein ACLP9L_30785, partial [Thermoguttaceae bacterium]